MMTTERVNIRKLTLAAALIAAVAYTSCADTGEEEQTRTGAVTFTVEDVAGVVTRSASELTTGNITSFGVFAHHTGNKNFAAVANGDEGWRPNFMYGQSVTRANDTSPWTYSPVKYWPYAADEKVSFFALSPTPSASNGLTAPAADYAGGYPEITFTPASDVVQQLDFCVASAVDRTAAAGSVPFTFTHALTKINFDAKYSGFIPEGTYLSLTQIVLRKVYSEGALVFTASPAGFEWNIDNNSAADYTLEQASGHLLGHALTESLQSFSTQMGTLMLLPQTLPDEATIETYISLLSASGGYSITEFVVSVSVGGMVWPAAKEVNYGLNINIGVLTEVGFTVNIEDWVTVTPNSGIEIH
jgi:hypothetical protein